MVGIPEITPLLQVNPGGKLAALMTQTQLVLPRELAATKE